MGERGEIVEKSIMGQEWKLAAVDEILAGRVSQQNDIADVVARVMLVRGISPEGASDFIAPKLKRLLPDPSTMKDMDKAARRVADAIKNSEGIGIFGDYDVDGATASALLHRFFRMAGVPENKIFVHIPDRKDEGYGLSAAGLRDLKEKGAALVVAVDCGITAFDAAEEAEKIGLSLVIADHHESEVAIPRAAAVVDAKRVDDTSGLSNLAACGVAFLLSVAANRLLREEGHYKNGAEPDLFSLLDLVALGTVCDVVPLVGVNRAFVSAGLKILAKRTNPGLKALSDIAHAGAAPTAFDLGYILGPRINAGGRVGDSSLGEKLLSTDNRLEAEHYAAKLDNFNNERKAIENAVIQAAEGKMESSSLEEDGFIFISGADWHTGVIGIIAGRLKEKYRVPALVATELEGGLANGSARSIVGVDIGAAIIRAKEEGILIEGGGHFMAAGFTLPIEKIPEFKKFLKGFIASGEAGKTPVLTIDAVLDPSGVTGELMKSIEVLEPFGSGNEEPRFALLGARLSSSDAIGGGNIRAYFASDNGKGIPAILYRGADTVLGEALLSGVGKHFKVAGKARVNEYLGRKNLQFVIDDMAEA